MIEIINDYLDETPFRCFCATFKCPENNPPNGIALFIYERRIWPASFLDRFLRLRKIIAFIIPVAKQVPGKHEAVFIKVLYRSTRGRKQMRVHHFDAVKIFYEIIHEKIETCSPKTKAPAVRPLRHVSLPETPREWYE